MSSSVMLTVPKDFGFVVLVIALSWLMNFYLIAIVVMAGPFRDSVFKSNRRSV